MAQLLEVKNKELMRRTLLCIYSFVISLFILDRYTKIWALKTLSMQDITLFPGLTLSLSFNRGISWSFFSFSSPILFWGLTTFIIITLLWFSYLAFRSHALSSTTLGKLMVISGASSNIIDRFLYGGVIDFIECSLHNWHWPSFNIADATIVCGIGIILGRMYYDRLFSKDA
jgi:signal peptidase II